MGSLKYTDLEMAMEFTSDAYSFDAVVYLCRKTGKIYYGSDEYCPDEELPEDVDDSSLYAQVPDKRDLDLGKRLVMRFVSRALPDEYDKVDDIFHRKGAYSRYKDLLFKYGLLEDWYDFENLSTQKALCGWAEDEGFTVEIDRVPPKADTVTPG